MLDVVIETNLASHLDELLLRAHFSAPFSYANPQPRDFSLDDLGYFDFAELSGLTVTGRSVSGSPPAAEPP